MTVTTIDGISPRLVLFWYHSVELGEGGPQIRWYAHWLLDSTFAFIGLTPPVAVILPATPCSSPWSPRPARSHTTSSWGGVPGPPTG